MQLETVKRIDMAKLTKSRRKALFRAALALTGLSAEQWAVANGVTGSAVSLNLNGLRSGSPLSEQIDAFIAEHVGAHNIAATQRAVAAQ